MYLKNVIFGPSITQHRDISSRSVPLHAPPPPSFGLFCFTRWVLLLLLLLLLLSRDWGGVLLLAVLNRAVPEEEAKAKKTAQGRAFNRG